MLWDEEFKPLRGAFDELAGDRRFALAVAAMDRTLAELDPPLEGDHATDLLHEAMNTARAAVGGDFAGLSLRDGVPDQLSAMLRHSTESAVGPIVMAVIGCFSLPAEGMPAQTLYAVFSHCYEAVFEREEEQTGDLETVEDERANPRLTTTIAWQKNLLTRG
jgi:hypothetical protein